MTSDTTIYNKQNLPSAAISAALSRNMSRTNVVPSASLNDWLEEFAALIEKHGHELFGWSRKMSATLAHLKHAYAKLSHAENHIAELQRRIEVLQSVITTDELTGLKNRRGFREGFERELESCKRLNTIGGLLVMIDLDNFKSVNDTHGHLAGDAALKLVARTLAGEIRKTDMAARLGGDEFVLLLSNTTKEKAVSRAQVISSHLNNLSLAWNGDVIPLQASIGLKQFGPNDAADNIIHSADTSMYANKSAKKTEGKADNQMEQNAQTAIHS